MKEGGREGSRKGSRQAGREGDRYVFCLSVCFLLFFSFV